MDRQYDLRALLIQIEERLSNEDRHRLHFLVGDLIPRTQREDVTRAGTLTLLESLFDRDIINEDYLDFLIRTFNELKCYDAAKRLKEFQTPQKSLSSKERCLIADILNDNVEDDKLRTINTNTLFASQDSLNLLGKADVNKVEPPLISNKQAFSTDPNEVFDNINNLKTEARLQKLKATCLNFRLLWFLYILTVFLILGMIIYICVLLSNKSSEQTSIYANINKVYLPELGNLPSDVEGTWFDHSQDLELTYADRLIRLDAYAYHNTLFSINFTYSNHKTRQHQLRNLTQLHQLNISSLDFQQRNLQDISICYSNKTRTKQLIGLDFSLGDDTHKYFGSCAGEIHVDDSFSEHLFGYAQGKTTDHLQGIQFLWFKICSFNELTSSCTNKKSYVLPLTNYYLD